MCDNTSGPLTHPHTHTIFFIYKALSKRYLYIIKQIFYVTYTQQIFKLICYIIVYSYKSLGSQGTCTNTLQLHSSCQPRQVTDRSCSIQTNTLSYQVIKDNMGVSSTSVVLVQESKAHASMLLIVTTWNVRFFTARRWARINAMHYGISC